MTWEELLTWAIIDTWIVIQGSTWQIINNTIENSFGDPSLLSWVFALFKWLFVAVLPIIKWLWIILVVLLMLYILVLLVFTFLTKREKKKVKNDISQEHREFKEIWKQMVVRNMLEYGSVYDPKYENEINIWGQWFEDLWNDQEQKKEEISDKQIKNNENSEWNKISLDFNKSTNVKKVVL